MPESEEATFEPARLSRDNRVSVLACQFGRSGREPGHHDQQADHPGQHQPRRHHVGGEDVRDRFEATHLEPSECDQIQGLDHVA